MVARLHRPLGHTPSHARRAEAAALAREGDTQLVAAAAAGCPQEALREVAADGEAAMGGQRDLHPHPRFATLDLN